MSADRIGRGIGALALLAALALPGAAGAGEAPTAAERSTYLSAGADAPAPATGPGRAGAEPGAGPSTNAFRRSDVNIFYRDTPGDSGQAADLLGFQFTHLDGDPGTAADDRLAMTTVLDGNPAAEGAQADLIDGDVVLWFFDTDNSTATGGLGGFDRAVRLRGVNPPAAGDTYEFLRWSPSRDDFELVQRLTNIAPVSPDSVAWSIHQASWGVARGGVVRWYAAASYPRTATTRYVDLAPDGDDFYFFAVPDGPFAPAVGTVASVSAVGTTSATFNGSVDPQGLETSYVFQYGTTTAYGGETARQSAGAGRGLVPVSAGASGLAEGTTYHYRLVATNAAGSSVGPDQTLTTARTPRVPDAVTRVATRIGQRTLTMNGTVDPNGSATRYFFEWGRTTRYGRRTPQGSLSAAARPTAVSVPLRGLRRNTPYHYRLVAVNADGTKVGQDMLVRTRPRPRADVVQSILRITHACSRRTRVCQITNMPLRVQVADGDTGRRLGAAARRGLTVSIRVRARANGPLRQSFRLSRQVRTRALGTGAPTVLRVRGTATTSRTDLRKLFPGRFAPGTSIELRVNGRGVVGAYHRIDFTRSRVVQSNCFLPIGSASPRSCERL